MTARDNTQGRFQEFLVGPSLSISARRSHLYEDAFSKLVTEGLTASYELFYSSFYLLLFPLSPPPPPPPSLSPPPPPPPFSSLSSFSFNFSDLRKRLRVQLINEQGLEEAGIDGGGLFREFLTETLKTGFDPNRGFFTTTKEGFLYPNPNAHLVNNDHALHYKFLGALLGKVIEADVHFGF